MSSGTLYDKVWDLHRVTDLRWIHAIVSLHLIHEVTSPQAFAALKDKGLMRCPERTVATVDHIVPTISQQRPVQIPWLRRCSAPWRETALSTALCSMAWEAVARASCM